MEVFAATMSGFEVDNAIKHDNHTSKNEVFQTIKKRKGVSRSELYKTTRFMTRLSAFSCFLMKLTRGLHALSQE